MWGSNAIGPATTFGTGRTNLIQLSFFFFLFHFSFPFFFLLLLFFSFSFSFLPRGVGDGKTRGDTRKRDAGGSRGGGGGGGSPTHTCSHDCIKDLKTIP